MPLPAALTHDWPPTLRATDERGWFRFQRLYDIAQAVIRTADDVRAADDPELLERIAAINVVLEVCPTSNVALGVAPTAADVPLPRLIAAGAPVALGADKPLLFGARLARQYEISREAHGLADEDLADLARCSIRGSGAPEDLKKRMLVGVDAWLANPQTRPPLPPPVAGDHAET